MKEEHSSSEHRVQAEFPRDTRSRSSEYEEILQTYPTQLFSIQHFPTPLLPLIGREQEVNAICTLLQEPEIRLLNLVGPGGVGKTRLALKVAIESATVFKDGIYFVSLAHIHTVDEVFPTIALTLSLVEKQECLLLAKIQAVMQSKHFLLLLDNFEQVADAAPQLQKLLVICPYLKILVTSHAVLGMLEERVFYVSPLALPNLAYPPSYDDLSQLPAISLFLQRARAARPDFALTPRNVYTIAQICVRLDGLPLALELAAARLKLFSPQELLARLNHRLSLLSGGPRGAPERQQTLRKTVERSYRLLTPDEQRLFRRLSVFIGGSTFQAVEAVTRVAGKQSEPLLDATTSLLDQSLIRSEPQRGTEDQRFTMLGILWEYALELLQNSDEEETIRQAHAEYYLELANILEQKVVKGESPYWVEWIESEFENLRAAFGWFLSSRDAERALSMSGALWPFWLQSSTVEGYSWIRQALDCCPESVTPVQTDTRAQAVHIAAMLEYYKGNWAHADTLADETLLLFRTTGNAHGVARVLITQGIGALLRGLYSVASAAVEESIQILQTTQHAWLSTEAFLVLSYSKYLQGDHLRAYKLGKKCFRLGRQSGELCTMMRVIYALALFAQSQGNYAEVENMYEEAMAISCATVKTGACSPIAACLIGLGAIVALQKQYTWALHLWARARMLYKRRDGLSEPDKWVENILRTHLLYSKVVDEVRTQLGEQTFIAAWNEEQYMTLEQLLVKPEIQTQLITSSTSTKVPAPYVDGLTAREREVLQLLAQGLSNAFIAEQLVIGLATVNSHVRTIYSKLGVSSRSAATRYALEHHLA